MSRVPLERRYQALNAKVNIYPLIKYNVVYDHAIGVKPAPISRLRYHTETDSAPGKLRADGASCAAEYDWS